MIDGSSGMPIALLGLGLGAWLLLTLYLAPRLHSLGGLLYILLSARYITTFFHDYTTKAVFAGQSINSFLTLGLTALCLLITWRDLLRYKVFLPVFAMILALLMSGFWNMELTGTVNALIRQLLFLSLMILVAKAVDAEANDGSTSRAMLAAFVVPILYQLMSIVLRLGKASESDGSVSFMGGYVHEGVFSTLLLTALVIAALAAGLSWRRRSIYVAVIFAALVFANYRTAVLSGVPILLAHFIFGSATVARARLGNYVRSGAFLLALIIGFTVAGLFSQRMADLGTLLTSGGGLIRPPMELTPDDRSLLSGRILIWNDYFFTTLRSDISHLVFGFGPDSWQRAFALYAHNVYISYIYELGFVGALIFAYMQLHFIVLAVLARPDKRWHLLGAHISYGLLCLGTMPTFTIEGVILYAVICGYTVYYYLYQRVPAKRVMSGSRLAPLRHGFAQP
ncbi:hypothetical protein [Devosia nitrariae]|uniref:O-antigen polymerase n=1 Tax=Devosia nitrariae TaxID=2071872 RepID=A0ABQ5WCW1_9HYPH|nr:hypothetical protein [Devosia nitrariae]GLQ57939.1 O-antigen polymerase [Devosia nitrariae]